MRAGHRVTGIGLARPADIPVLQEIERKAAELFLTHPQTSSLELSMTPRSRYTAAERAGMLLVARSGGVPVGFAIMEDLGVSIHLEELDVDPAHGRRGIGTGLVRAVSGMAAARGLPVTLCTFSEVPWNAPFYEKLGFVRLPPGNVPAALKRRVREETGRGLSPDIRVVMRFDGTRGPGGIEFREAVLSDLQGLLDLYRQLSPENARYSLEKAQAVWAGISANPDYRYFVAVESGAVAGSCNVSVIPNLTRGCRPFAVVENVITDVSRRKRGIGRRLMEIAVGFARAKNCYKVMLLSSAKRTEAHLFYESMGFNGSSKKGFELRME